MLKNLFHNFHIHLILLILLTIINTYLILQSEWVYFICFFFIWSFFLYKIVLSNKLNAQKIAFMFDAIDNNDYAFQYTTQGRSSNDKLVNESLNRIIKIILQAKAEVIQKEKYYELIMNQVNTGIIVLDDNGFIYQINNEAKRLLGLNILTHICQLSRIDKKLETTIRNIQPGNKHQVSFTNERGEVHLSIHVSDMTLEKKHIRILAINDINNELEEKEIDSWIRLTRVLTHEIMNSVTPITSLSETLLSLPKEIDEDIRNGLEVIRSTGKSLISFVDSYRKFTHIPTPEPTLFYVQEFIERIVKLACHQNNYPNISIQIQIVPKDLIIYADENLISQVLLNLLKNAMQAIGEEQKDGLIEIKAYINKEETIFIEVSNNGPIIPPEEIDHIFIPFFSTKEKGSGIGLSISRQIMRLSGGNISLKSSSKIGKTIFTLEFP